MTTASLGRYMTADLHRDEGGDFWTVNMRNGGSVLGKVAYYAPWKAWVFQPGEMTEFSADCLRSLSHESRTKTAPRRLLVRGRHRESDGARALEAVRGHQGDHGMSDVAFLAKGDRFRLTTHGHRIHSPIIG